MSWADIRAEVASILGGVSGVTNVHEYLRWNKSWGGLLDLFKDEANSQINGWMITRTRRSSEPRDKDAALVGHHIKITGVLGQDDDNETEHDFQALVESIGAAFKAKFQLSGEVEYTTLIQADIIEPRMFGTVLCHYCELTFIAYEYATWS